MAISSPRPDPSSPNEVASAGFPTARRGFDQSEVRDFLRMVAAELARLQERERYLERELRGAQQRVGSGPVEFDEETATRLLGEEAAHILQAAREGAVAIRTRAEEGAARLLREATDEAQRLREEAEVEAARRRQDASADAEAELQMAKQQGREMVNEARAYRERVLSELARRRELARQQIEQLIHGRDRLLQVFERARLVAVDVMADLTPLGGPDEYVNLSPTTGPVPVMVPAEPLVSPVSLLDDAGDDRELDDVAVDDAAAAEETGVDAPAGDVAMAGDDVDTDAGEQQHLVEDAVDAVDAVGAADAEDTADAEAAAEAPAVGGDVEIESDAEAAPDADVDGEVDAEVDGEVDADVQAGDVVPMPDAAAGDDATSDDDEREPAPVVALFAQDDPLAVDLSEDRHPLDDTTAVDNLFARLRAARAESIAERAAAAAASVPAAPDTPAATDEQATPEAARDDAPLFERRDSALVPVITAAARKLKRVLADEQNHVLDTLRRKDPVRTLDTLVPWEGDHVAQYTDAIGVELLTAAVTGAASVSSAPESKHSKDIERTAALKPVCEALAAELVAPLRRRLEAGIERADGDNAELATHVRAIYREWKTQRIDETFADIARMAFGHGAFAAVKKGTPMVWKVDKSREGCADCEDNSLAGAVPAGSEFPTGHRCAPAHTGCRCLVTPTPQ